MADALSGQIEVNHLAVMSSYGTNLQDRILQRGQQDVKYMDIMHRLEHNTGIGIDCSTSIGTSGSTCIGTRDNTGSGTSTGIGASAQDVDYFLIVDGLFRFRERIYMCQTIVNSKR